MESEMRTQHRETVEHYQRDESTQISQQFRIFAASCLLTFCWNISLAKQSAFSMSVFALPLRDQLKEASLGKYLIRLYISMLQLVWTYFEYNLSFSYWVKTRFLPGDIRSFPYLWHTSTKICSVIVNGGKIGVWEHTEAKWVSYEQNNKHSPKMWWACNTGLHFHLRKKHLMKTA